MGQSDDMPGLPGKNTLYAIFLLSRTGRIWDQILAPWPDFEAGLTIM